MYQASDWFVLGVWHVFGLTVEDGQVFGLVVSDWRVIGLILVD